MRRLSYSLLALLAFFTVSCSSSTDPDDNNNGGNNNGGIGLNSTYSFTSSATDLDGNPLQSDQAFTLTVTGVNQSYKGRNGVTIFTYSVNNAAEYYQFGSDHKVGRYAALYNLNGPGGQRWIDFPFGGGTTEVHLDTTVSISGNPFNIKMDLVLSYAGEETITIAGQQVATKKVIQQESGEMDFAGENIHTRTATYWYAPSLKQVVKQHIVTDGEGFLVTPSIIDAVVTGYQLK